MPRRPAQPGFRKRFLRRRQARVRPTRALRRLLRARILVGTESPEINAARVARRVLQGGHEVPIRKIVDRWARSIANAASIAAEVDRFYVYDNSVDDRDAQLVLRASNGHIARQYGEPPSWSVPIITRLIRGTDEP